MSQRFSPSIIESAALSLLIFQVYAKTHMQPCSGARTSASYSLPIYLEGPGTVLGRGACNVAHRTLNNELTDKLGKCCRVSKNVTLFKFYCILMT